MGTRLKIAHLYPELLNLYGDGGNIITLKKRCEWRGIEIEVMPVHYGDILTLSNVDIVFIGGGSDREQKIVCDQLLGYASELRSYVEDDGVLLAVCGGYQLLGHSYIMGDDVLPGLSLVDFYTDRGSPRLVGNIMIDSPLAVHPIVGYENHGGRTHLASSIEPLGRVVRGWGNDDVSGYEGCRWRNVVGTYLHGPLLPKNPELADWLLGRALEHRGFEDELLPLDDTEELQANAVMAARIAAGEA